MFSKLLGLMLSHAARKAPSHARDLRLFRLRCHEAWGEPVLLPIRGPGLPILPCYRQVAWQNQEKQADLGGIPTV